MSAGFMFRMSLWFFAISIIAEMLGHQHAAYMFLVMSVSYGAVGCTLMT
jgi:hypothetical protein